MLQILYCDDKKIYLSHKSALHKEFAEYSLRDENNIKKNEKLKTQMSLCCSPVKRFIIYIVHCSL